MGLKKKIFPAEFADEVAGVLASGSRIENDPSEMMVVALQPEVRIFCRKKGLDHVDTLPFFDNGSHRRVLMKSHELTTLMRDALSFDALPGRENVFMDTFLYYSRFYINHFLWLIEIMSGIEAKYQGHPILRLHRDEGRIERSFSAEPFLSDRDRFLSSIVGKYCREHGLQMERVEAASACFNPESVRNRKKVPQIWATVLRKLYRSKIKKLTGRNTVFITAPSYNLDRLCRDIRSRFPKVLILSNMTGNISAAGCVRLSAKEILEGLTGKAADKQPIRIPVKIFNTKDKGLRNDCLRAIERSFAKFAADFHREFVHADCRFWEEFEGKVKSDLMESLVELRDTDSGQNIFLESLRPNLVISALSIGEYQNWAETSRSCDIPALVIPQKMLLAPTDPCAQIEESYIGRAQVTDSYANTAAQSPLIRKYLEWTGYKGNILETENLIFSKIDRQTRQEKRERLFAEIGGQKKIILWAPSMKTRRSRRFHVLETIDELLAAMEEVFGVIAGMSEVHLIFRKHPGAALTKDAIFSLLPVPGNVSVDDSGPFENALTLADLLLSFSSTSILESFMNHTPVLLYDRWKRYNHCGARRVDDSLPRQISPVYYVDEIENLSQIIRWILREHGKEYDHSGLYREYVHQTQQGDTFFDFVGECLR